jgi:hypothetical protein
MGMDPRSRARRLAIGRMGFGFALLFLPRWIMTSWVGKYAKHPAVRMVGRSVGARDIVIGAIALHTVDHPEIGPRWQATCGMVDTADLLANIAARWWRRSRRRRASSSRARSSGAERGTAVRRLSRWRLCCTTARAYTWRQGRAATAA